MRFAWILMLCAIAGLVACENESNQSTRTITAGTTLTFTNQDGFAHTVTSSSVPSGAMAFDSGNVFANGTFQVTLNVIGTYEYFCSIHGTATTGMRGTIVVN